MPNQNQTGQFNQWKADWWMWLKQITYLNIHLLQLRETGKCTVLSVQWMLWQIFWDERWSRKGDSKTWYKTKKIPHTNVWCCTSFRLDQLLKRSFRDINFIWKFLALQSCPCGSPCQNATLLHKMGKPLFHMPWERDVWSKWLEERVPKSPGGHLTFLHAVWRHPIHGTNW